MATPREEWGSNGVEQPRIAAWSNGKARISDARAKQGRAAQGVARAKQC